MKPSTKILMKSLGDRLIGKSTSDRIYLRLCIRRYMAAGVVFVHVPKAAGTSVATATIGRRAGHFTAAEIRAAMGPAFDRMFTFSVVRNPMDRLASAYRFARRGGGDSGAVSTISSKFVIGSSGRPRLNEV